MTRVQLKPEYCSVHQNMVRGDGWGLENNTIPACSWCAEHQGLVHHRGRVFHIMVPNTMVDQHGGAWYDAVCILHHTMPHCVHNVWYLIIYTVIIYTVHLHGAHSLVHAHPPIKAWSLQNNPFTPWMLLQIVCSSNAAR